MTTQTNKTKKAEKPVSKRAKTTKGKKPTVLITGAAGALAQQVIARLRDHTQIVAVDFRQETFHGEDIPSYKLDYNKRVFEDLFKKYDFDSVIHLGRIQSSEETMLRRYNANVLGTHKLMDLSHKYGIRHVLILSTYHVYGADAYNPALIDESAPLKAAELTQDLVDSVELENLANIYLWKYPDLHITILRPCNIIGPGVNNTISRLLSSKFPPCLLGFSPIMQFIHIEDMADAIELAYKKCHRGVFNVAPSDWVAYQDALELCGGTPIPVPSIPPILPRMIAKILNLKSFPPYLLNYFKYPVVIDGREFENTFGFKAKHSLQEIFSSYKNFKQV